LRNTFHIVDVPKAVSILTRKGYPVTSKRNHDGTATYYYDSPPDQGFKEKDFIWVGNHAIRREEPKQEALI